MLFSYNISIKFKWWNYGRAIKISSVTDAEIDNKTSDSSFLDIRRILRNLIKGA